MGLQVWEMTIDPTRMTTVMQNPQRIADDMTRTYKDAGGIMLEEFVATDSNTVYVIADIKDEAMAAAIDRSVKAGGLIASTKHTSVMKL